MSPVAPSSGHATRALTLAFAAVAVGMLALWGASALVTSRHNNRVPNRSVGGVVDLGPAKSLARQIEHGNGVPLYFPDVSGNNARSVYVSHRGTSLNTGWSAFLAQVPGKANSCLWQWNTKLKAFQATCDATMTADHLGTGLTQYPVRVTKKRLRVDLTVQTTVRSTTSIIAKSVPQPAP